MSPSTLTGRWLSAAVLSLLASHAAAGELPQMQFDTGHAVACRAVSGKDAQRPSPDEKIIEAVFRISMLQSAGGNDAALEQVLIEIVSPRRRLRVVQLSPKTELTTEYEGPIAREQTETHSRSLEAGVDGTISDPGGLFDVEIEPDIGAGIGRAKTIKETSRRLAPRIAAVAAGTLHNQHGAFFKLTPNSQSVLEGERTFTCRFAVPANWRADWAVVRCRAFGRRDELFGGERIEPCGGAKFFVGLYLHDDVEARAAAEGLVQAATARPAVVPPPPFSGALREARRWLCAKPVVEGEPGELERAIAELASLSGTRTVIDIAPQVPPIPVAED